MLPSSAQAPAQLSWAELVVLLLYPAPARPQYSSEKAGNKQNLLSNICRSTLGELKTFFGRRPQILMWMEDGLNLMEDDLTFVCKWKTFVFGNWSQPQFLRQMEDDIYFEGK
jgi:hypothetical protein